MTDRSPTAQLLAEYPPNWEYRLTALWLREGLTGVDRQLADLHRGAIFRRSTVLDITDFSRWARQKIDDLTALTGVLATVLTADLTSACGDLTRLSDPDAIRQAVERLIEMGEHLAAWEIEVHFVRVDDDEVQSVKALMSGWAEDVLRQLETLPARLERTVGQAAPGGHYDVPLAFTPPATLTKFTRRLNRIGQARLTAATKRRRWSAPFVALVAGLVVALAMLCLLVNGLG